MDVPIRYTDGPASNTCPRSQDASLEHIEDAIKEKVPGIEVVFRQ